MGRGRIPRRMHAFAATACVFDFLRPPRRPVAAANRRVPNARSTASRFDWDALSSPGIIARGIAIDPPPPNVRSTRSRLPSSRALTTADGCCARACPRARARAYRSRSFDVTSVVPMNLRPRKCPRRSPSPHPSLVQVHLAAQASDVPPHAAFEGGDRLVERDQRRFRECLLEVHPLQKSVERRTQRLSPI
jgi:hypothetical protein